MNPTINLVFPTLTCFADRFGQLTELSDALLLQEETPFLGLPPSVDRVTRDIADQAGADLQPVICDLKERLAWLLRSHEPESSRWHLHAFVRQYKRFPLHAMYYSSHAEQNQHVPFPARAFAILDRVTGSGLLFHVLVHQMDVSPRDYVHETWTLDALKAVGVTQRPEENTLFVWRPGVSWLEASPTPPGTAVVMHLDNFHDRARIGAVATLMAHLGEEMSRHPRALDMAAGVAAAERRPARIDARVLDEFMPGTSFKERRQARRWAREYVAREDGSPQAIAAAKMLVDDLKTASPARRVDCRATVAGLLTFAGLLGAPHVLTNDVPETVHTVIEAVRWVSDHID